MVREIIFVAIIALICCACGGTKPKRDDRTPALSPAPPERDTRPVIVSFGNSLTAGAGVEPDANYPARLQARIDREGYRYRVVNAGISGETSSQGLSRVESVLALAPAIVIVEFGANDGLRGLPVDTIRRNIAAIITRLKSAGTMVVLAGMEVPPNYGPRYTTAFRGIFPNLAKEHRVPLIPFFLKGVGGHIDLNQDDGIHPTGEGYDIVVENVWEVLQPML